MPPVSLDTEHLNMYEESNPHQFDACHERWGVTGPKHTSLSKSKYAEIRYLRTLYDLVKG